MTPEATARRVRGLTRREALLLGLLGAAGAYGAYVLLPSWLRRAYAANAPADIFAGDAPCKELWALWLKRGWAREALHYLRLDGNVQCKLCPNNCLLKPGDRSHCRNRVNVDGTLYTMAYANPCTFHVDPVEKKPLFHYLPSSMSFSLATSGCVFRCLNCQNWEISQKKPEETKDPRGPELRLQVPLPASLDLDGMRRLSLFPEDLPDVAQALRCPSISYTYSEPTAFYEYTLASCRAAHARGVKNIIVTCGSIEQRPLAELLPHVDAAHVDLKGFSDDVYRTLNAGKLQTILDTLQLYRRTGVWFEIVNLIVPTYTDDLPTIRRMCDWIVSRLGPDTPLHFSRFHPQHKLAHLWPTPVETMVQAREIARAAGLRYVYLGNVREPVDAGTTWCPGCKKAVVERDIFAVTSLQVTQGKCRFCQTPIAGVWGV